MNLLRAERECFTKDTYATFEKHLDNAKKERDVLKFLNENVYLFNILDHAWNGKHGRANFRFGSDYIADFIIMSAHSGSWIIRLIEAQSPTDTIYTKKYEETQGLREARRQIAEWKIWIANNPLQFRQALASVVDDNTPSYCSNASLHQCAKTELLDLNTPVEIRYSALIGRRESRDAKKNQLALQNTDFSIMTYDRLLDGAEKMRDAILELEAWQARAEVE